ncbi:unnamed protein product [Lactuca virosa]|uniref:Bet v I/Major latex protein domain-containing protein n=1 Tax=Lactuca virosa TaxID=75947 RepID=A0AAU9MXV5_9ASTR|nr:unnamed protein product [Lactuca virosa]
MSGKISEEVEVKVSITEAWEVYSTLKLAMILQSELPHLYGVDILEGDGGVGTIIKVTPRPGVSVKPAFKERFTKIDHEKRVKEIEIIEGGYLDMGCTSYRITLEFMEKENEESSCILRVTVEYEANEDASFVTIKPLMNTLKFVNQYLQNNKI